MSENFDQPYWEEQYRGRPHGHGTAHAERPNPQLAAETGDLAPGLALDAGCGEGADARWLASRGWRVTAVDISTTALDRARERAASLGEEAASRIEWVDADLTDWTPEEGGFDLVSTHYVHLAGSHQELYRRLAAAVAPGGTLLIVGHHPSAHQHASSAHAYITADDVAAVLDPDRWEIAVAETRSRSVTGPHGDELTLRDTVLRARRLM